MEINLSKHTSKQVSVGIGPNLASGRIAVNPSNSALYTREIVIKDRGDKTHSAETARAVFTLYIYKMPNLVTWRQAK